MSQRTIKKKNRLTASMMAFVGGMIGLHKFYLQKPGQGFFYLMFLIMAVRIFGFPISALLGFMDGMKMLSMSDRAFDAKYNKEYLAMQQQQPVTVQKTRTTRTKSKAPFIPKANPYKKSGITKYREFALEEAIVDFEKGLEIEPNDVSLHFNLACAYSLTEKKQKVLFHLDKAVSLGFTDFERITSHDDLSYIRIQPEYEAFKNKGFRLSGENLGESIVKDDVLLAQLNRLSALRKQGILSEDEFVLERKKLLKR